jgi:hypothetical protein
VPYTATAQEDGWDSGLIEAGGEWETMVTDKMTQAYYCGVHPSMIATLNIEPE